jgi:hypothetical protein
MSARELFNNHRTEKFLSAQDSDASGKAHQPHGGDSQCGKKDAPLSKGGQHPNVIKPTKHHKGVRMKGDNNSVRKPKTIGC